MEKPVTRHGLVDLPPGEFADILQDTVRIIAGMYRNIDDKKVYHARDFDQFSSLFEEALPEGPTSMRSILTKIEKDVLPHSALHYSPHFYAWVTSCASQASLVAEMLATAANVNATTWMNATAASQIEQLVIRWIGQFIDYHEDSSGVLLSGGSVANLSALKVCLTQKASYDIDTDGIDSSQKMTFYMSEQGHHCIDKAMKTLGIGTRQLRKIRVLDDFSVDLHAMDQQICQDIENGELPVCIIASAGTVNTGAVDDLSGAATLAKKHNMWLHVDAAYGGFAASTELRRTVFEGLEQADSLVLDAHKWFFVPFECSCLLVKKAGHLTKSFSHIPEYQKFRPDKDKVDFSEYSIQQSRNFKALKLWMNFKTYGTTGLRGAIQKSLDQVNEFASLIDRDEDFELMSRPTLSIVCFRYHPANASLTLSLLTALNLSIVERVILGQSVFIKETILHGAVVIRICCTNFRREPQHCVHMLDVIRKTGKDILSR